MKIYTTVKPLFAAQGKSKEHGKVIFLFSKYEAAQAKATELIHQCYTKVSVYRVGE